MNKNTMIVVGFVCALLFAGLCWIIYMGIATENFDVIGNSASIEKNPDQPEMYYTRGCNHLSFVNTYQNPLKSEEEAQKDWVRENDLAEKDFSRAIELAPDCANAYLERVRCMEWRLAGAEPAESAKLRAKIIADLETVKKLTPYGTEAGIRLVGYYAGRGEIEKAREECATAVALVSDQVDKDDIERPLNRPQK